MFEKSKNDLKILYVTPSSIRDTGVAAYALKFKEHIEKADLYNVKMEFCLLGIHINFFRELIHLRKGIPDLSKDFHLIHAELSSSSQKEFWILYFLINRYPSIPVIITVHDAPYLCLNPFYINWLKKYNNFLPIKVLRKMLEIGVGYWVERKIMKKTRVVFATTRCGAKEIKKRFPQMKNIFYLPHISFYEKEFKENDEKDEYILFFGFIRKGKGLEILIEAFQRLILQNGFNQLRLVICGGYKRDHYYHYILKKIKDLNLEKKVVITNFVDEKEVIHLLNKSLCCVFPYENKKTISSSGAVIRALSAGCPIVISNISMLTEYVKNGQNGLVFQENNSEDLYCKLLTLLKDKQLRENLSKNAIEYIKKKHNNHVIAEKVIQMYNEVLNHKV